MVLLDFESAAIGPREWDLLPTAIGVERYGRPERAVPGVRRHLRLRRPRLAGLPGAAGGPGADDDDVDHAEHRGVPSRRRRVRPASRLTCGKEISHVPGTSSAAPPQAEPGGPTPAARRPVPGKHPDHQHLRHALAPADAASNGELPGHLRLWRFEQYYRLSADQLPAVLHQEALDASTLRFQRWQHAGTLTGARIWLFAHAVGPDRGRAQPGGARAS